MPDELERQIWVEASADLNGLLRFQSFAPTTEWDKAGKPLLDRFDSLRNWMFAPDLVREMQEAGLEFHFVGNAEADFNRFLNMCTDEFKVDAPFLEKYKLREFQRIGCNFASRTKRVLICQGTGTGKTVCGCLVSQKLVDDNEIDLVILICKRAKKVDWESFYRDNTRLTVYRATGTRAARHKAYEEWDRDVLVVNYETIRAPQKTNDGKDDWSRTDLREIMKLVRGKRVLFLFDEAQKMGNRDSLTSKGCRRLCSPPKTERNKAKDIRVIGLTATPYRTAPYNIRNIFSVIVPNLPRVSGPKAEFEDEYVAEFGIWGVKSWDSRGLQKLGRRIEPYTHTALKSDPAIAAQFPKMTEREVTLEMSARDRALYKRIVKRSKEMWASNRADNNQAANLANFGLLRMVCNTAEALRYSTSDYAQQLLGEDGLSFDTADSAKYAAVEALIETIVEQDDKLVCFSFWANAVIKPYIAQLAKNKKFKDVPIFTYTGNQKEEEQARQLAEFNRVSAGAVMLMSDAGQEGINAYAPYLAHIELPFTYSDYTQRRDRIHRIDSIEHGIEQVFIYRFVTQNSIEERISDRMFERRGHAELIHSDSDVISEDTTISMDAYYDLIADEDE